VEIPYAVNAVYGNHFKGVMGTGIVEPEFRFRVLDQAGNALRTTRLYFSVVEGDGALLADSLLPDANGAILNNYTFDGQLGYGLVRATVPGVDTLDVKVRASVIRFGADGQGQYVRLSDVYSDVVALNGLPDSVRPDPFVWRNYAIYEDNLSVVLAITDLNQSETAEPDEPISKIILNNAFAARSPEGIGIGSPIADVRSAYDTADYHFYDPVYPPAEGFVYNTLGAIFYASTTDVDSAIIEIHLSTPSPPGAASLNRSTIKARNESMVFRRSWSR
jgi:hypothetical protein